MCHHQTRDHRKWDRIWHLANMYLLCQCVCLGVGRDHRKWLISSLSRVYLHYNTELWVLFRVVQLKLVKVSTLNEVFWLMQLLSWLTVYQCKTTSIYIASVWFQINIRQLFNYWIFQNVLFKHAQTTNTPSFESYIEFVTRHVWVSSKF